MRFKNNNLQTSNLVFKYPGFGKQSGVVIVKGFYEEIKYYTISYQLSALSTKVFM